MHFTTQSKKSAGALTLNQIIFAFVLLIIVLVGQASALPTSIEIGHRPETGHRGDE